jgi:HD-GYP domain-containing protein (c-di-GMP phosphodiesterase class II)
MSSIQLAAILIGLLVLGGFWAFGRLLKRKEEELRLALESAQQKLDHQTARLNILTRALPNLQSILKDHHTSEGWKSVILDEARALLGVESALYLKISERDRKIELESQKGFPHPPDFGDYESGVLSDVIRRRRAQILPDGGLAVPVVVEGGLWGIFYFLHADHKNFLPRDIEIATMLMEQTSLALENRSMVNNRERFYLELVQALADTLDSRDASTEGQTRQARMLARGIGKEMGLPEDFIYYLEFAALMHDIGNIAIDEQLLKKPGKLTAQEFEMVKKHPEFGYKILAPVSLLAPVAPMVLYHQEWFNGKGYPEGLRGEEIPLGARIVSVLDAWGGMTSHRPWRKAMTKEQALSELQKGSGSQFDPKVVDAFVASLQRQKIVA